MMCILNIVMHILYIVKEMLTPDWTNAAKWDSKKLIII